MKKCPYLSPWAENEKNKDTLFSQTFKIEENKVMLFFHFELKWKSYGHFKILKLSLFEIKILKWENGHNSLILASGFLQGELYCSRHFFKETLREVAYSAEIVLQVGLTLGLYCSIHFYKET